MFIQQGSYEWNAWLFVRCATKESHFKIFLTDINVLPQALELGFRDFAQQEIPEHLQALGGSQFLWIDEIGIEMGPLQVGQDLHQIAQAPISMP